MSEPSQEISHILSACTPSPGLVALKLITLRLSGQQAFHLLQRIVKFSTSLGQRRRSVTESSYYQCPFGCCSQCFASGFPFSATFLFYFSTFQGQIMRYGSRLDAQKRHARSGFAPLGGSNVFHLAACPINKLQRGNVKSVGLCTSDSRHASSVSRFV